MLVQLPKTFPVKRSKTAQSPVNKGNALSNQETCVVRTRCLCVKSEEVGSWRIVLVCCFLVAS